jgi:predicted metalloprotease with PDZ domain
LKEDYFHFIGHAVFVCPDWDLNEPRKIRLVWNIPADDWNLANSFAVGQRSQMIERSLNEFCHAVFMGGDITVHEVDIYGCPLYISIQGQYRFDSNDFYDMVGKTARAVREYWQDYRFPYFLVTMIPTNQPCCSQGGTGLTNSYSLFISEEIDDVDDMKFLLTHEIFHVWNGRKIQREEPEELVYWFAEGFTDYFTRLILLRAGLITMPEYIDDVNSTIAELYESPARNITNRRILEKTHVDYTVECIPYLRGDLLALRWDARIKKTGSGNSLDNLMKDLLAAAVQSGVLVSAANIDSLISPYLPGGAMPDIRDYIDKGRMIPISSDALGPCAHLDTAECTPFDLGFTYERPPEGESWKIFGVDPDGPAYAAGLRNGQILLGRSITWNDTKKPVVLKIRDQNGVESILEYLPEGKSFSVPQFVFDSAAYNADSSYCHEWFGY